MNLDIFKTHYMLRPEQTLVIDRPFVLDGDEMHLLALTYKEGAYTLWVMDCLSEALDEGKMMFDSSTRTNRDNFSRWKMPYTRSIESLQIGAYTFKFDGSSTDSFHFQGNQAFYKLQYFIDQGIELSRWDQVALKKMQLTGHRHSGSVDKVHIDFKDEKIKLKFRQYHKEVEVFHKYSLDFNLKEPVELAYYNPFEEKEEVFYVQGFEIYTLEKYLDAIEKNDKYKILKKDQLDQMKEMVTDYFDRLNKRDSSLVLMTYEGDRGLSFKSTAYLDKKIEISSGSSGGAMGFIFRPDEKTGQHGKNLFVASFQEVPNDHLATMVFELHTVSKKFQEETVII